MTKKKIKVLELNKEKEKIVLEEEQSSWILFWKKYNKLLLLILFILSLAILISGIILAVSNLSSSEKLIIKHVSVDTDLDVNSADVTVNMSLSDSTAKKLFENNAIFKNNGEVLLVKTVEHSQYTIKFYSDYTAIKIMKNNNYITRINSIDGKKYGIKENGVINSNADTLDITILEEKIFSWGTVKYFSDNSAMIVGSDIDMFVRNSKDINEDYIASHKVSYLKDNSMIGDVKLNYYYDGTIEVIKNNKSYLVRSVNDLTITDNNVIFKNNNEATITNSIKLSGGIEIDYYTDGGAIIRDGSKKISVRKSNSIIIKDNKIYEIVDNIYVDICNKKNNGNIIYYTNGSAIIKNYNGKTVYVSDNSNIKYNNGKIILIDEKFEKLTEERNINSDKILKFESVAFIDTDEFMAIVPKDNIIYNSDGSFKEVIVDDGINDKKPITITNNTNDIIKYRLVIEKSDRTNLDVSYIKYQLSVGNKYVEPIRLDNNLWINDNVSKSLSVTGINYILLERTLLPQESDSINLMLWTDYDTIPNEMQNKYFYGTLRIYGWQEIETNL